MTTPTFEFVRFTIGTAPSARARLAHLVEAVEALAADKSKSPSGQVELEGNDELNVWTRILPPMALATFEAVPPRNAWMPPSGLIEPGWDELSMLGAVLGGETLLHGVHVNGGVGELRFEALTWPYGGITSIIRLVEAFGFDVVSYNEGSMPEVSRAEHVERSGR